jgi:hypothetical protein
MAWEGGRDQDNEWVMILNAILSRTAGEGGGGSQEKRTQRKDEENLIKLSTTHPWLIESSRVEGSLGVGVVDEDVFGEVTEFDELCPGDHSVVLVTVTTALPLLSLCGGGEHGLQAV